MGRCGKSVKKTRRIINMRAESIAKQKATRFRDLRSVNTHQVIADFVKVSYKLTLSFADVSLWKRMIILRIVETREVLHFQISYLTAIMISLKNLKALDVLLFQLCMARLRSFLVLRSVSSTR
jgi:hypothetical protein